MSRGVSRVTPFARLARHVRARRRGAACRVLLVAGAWRDMPVGDSIIATQHVPFLRRLGERVEITVWTIWPDLWEWLTPGVHATRPPRRLRAGDYDVAIFETTLGPVRVADDLSAAGVATVSWQAGDDRALVRLGARAPFSVPLPPLLNRTERIPEIYRRLGFPASPPASTRPRSAGAPVIYLNPYASRAKKAMPPTFFRGIVDALTRERGLDARIVVPAEPEGGSRDDRAAWKALSAIVRDAARRRALTIRPRATLDRYCDDVAASALVIGCDTSSQHLAQAIGRPSITCYPAAVGRHLHLFWGPVRDDAVHVDIPPDGRTRDRNGLIALVAKLSAAFVAPRVATSSESPLAGHADRFVEACVDYLRGRRASRVGASAALRRLHGALPPAWAPHVTEELARVYGDLPAVRASGAAARRMACARLRHLNAPRLARVLDRSYRTPRSTSIVS